MRYAIVKAGACSALGNRVFMIGDKVNEDNFHKGIFDQYIESGHLEVISEDDKPVSSPDQDEIKITEAKKKEEIPVKEEETQDDPEGEVTAENDATREEIIGQLKELGIKYKKTMSTNELYELWKAGK